MHSDSAAVKLNMTASIKECWPRHILETFDSVRYLIKNAVMQHILKMASPTDITDLIFYLSV